MLAGLIFATGEAEDRPDTLAATLPFGGMTLLEYQVRLLVGAGASQILVAVSRVTPALLGAVSRAARRGASVDIVRNAEEAVAKVHPLARVVVFADGLVTTDPIVERMAGEGREALLVTRDAASPVALERIDANHCWAGIARVPAQRFADVARMPRDYDFQSLLLRVAAQANADLVPLSPGWEKSGHAVELSSVALASRSNAVLAGLTERRVSWADRWIFTPIARALLPRLVERGVQGWTLLAGGAALGSGAVALAALGWPGVGLGLALVAVAGLVSGGAMAALRGEQRRAAAIEAMIAILAGAGAIAIAWPAHRVEGWTPMACALALTGAAWIAERVPARPRRWWGSPAGYLLLLTPFAIAGLSTIGLAAVATYAFATLAGAVEAARKKA